MRLDRGGVDEKLRRRAASLRERVEEIDPHALGRPPDITVVERLARPVFRRRVDPAPAGFQHVDNPADHAPIIDPRLAPRVSREVRRNLRKLGVGQPKTVGNHVRFLSEAVNHDVAPKPTTLWVRALDPSVKKQNVARGSVEHLIREWDAGRRHVLMDIRAPRGPIRRRRRQRHMCFAKSAAVSHLDVRRFARCRRAG